MPHASAHSLSAPLFGMRWIVRSGSTNVGMAPPSRGSRRPLRGSRMRVQTFVHIVRYMHSPSFGSRSLVDDPTPSVPFRTLFAKAGWPCLWLEPLQYTHANQKQKPEHHEPAYARNTMIKYGPWYGLVLSGASQRASACDDCVSYVNLCETRRTTPTCVVCDAW